MHQTLFLVSYGPRIPKKASLNMNNVRINFWYLASLFISLIVALPILTVFTSFFNTTSEYYELLKNTFLLTYITNSIIILSGVLFFTFLFGVTSAYFVSFYEFPSDSYCFLQ